MSEIERLSKLESALRLENIDLRIRYRDGEFLLSGKRGDKQIEISSEDLDEAIGRLCAALAKNAAISVLDTLEEVFDIFGASPKKRAKGDE